MKATKQATCKQRASNNEQATTCKTTNVQAIYVQAKKIIDPTDAVDKAKQNGTQKTNNQKRTTTQTIERRRAKTSYLRIVIWFIFSTFAVIIQGNGHCNLTLLHLNGQFRQQFASYCIDTTKISSSPVCV